MNHSTLHNILTVAKAEKRLTRRLKRYWIFVVLAYLAGLFIFGYYTAIHTLFSSFSATMGTINPHYLISIYSFVFQMIFSIGIVFTGFDIRARDVRERIVEVLDCRPVSNLELMLGRFFALFQLAWFPILFFCGLLQLLGWLLPLLGSPFGNTVEPDSLLLFATLQAIPSVSFSIALVFLVTLLVRNRVLSALVTIGILGALFAGLFYLPFEAYPLVDNFGTTMRAAFPTDLVTNFANLEGVLQRTGVLLLSFALLGYAIVLHPRLDDGNRPRTALYSSAMLVVGAVLLGASSLIQTANLGKAEWLTAHEAVEEMLEPDLVHMNATLVVEPGKDMQVDLQLAFKAPASSALETALFTLNPGFTVASITADNGQALAFSHENGLLQIELPDTLAAGEQMNLKLVYGGKPDIMFGYLDSKLKLTSLTDLNDRGLQGTEPGMFNKEFVALMPGIYWLPLAGNDVNRDDTRTRPRDYFGVELDIEVPSEWLVAGPGMRQSLAAGEGGNSRFRFAPQPELSEVALIASEFTRYSTDIQGIHFEILVYPEHTTNFTVLAPMQPEIEEWVENRLLLAQDAGLTYPFDAFTLVEVPNGLRVYKGGWRMDTALAPPGMMLMTESGFPTSRFDFSVLTFNTSAPGGGPEQQGLGINNDSFKTVSFDRLLNFFTSDLSGGNVFMGLSRSYFSHHTAATGPEAIALNFMLDMLATLVVSDERYYFSMYNNISATVTNLVNTVIQGGAVGQSITQRTINTFAADVEVWNSALNASLLDIDTTRDPEQTINLLTLKGGELAQAIYDVLGPRRAGEFLATLLREHHNTTFSLQDVVALLGSFDAELALLFEESFTSTQLPGFVAQSAKVYRLPDGASGEQRYQLLVELRNDETVAGFTRFAWVINSTVANEASQNFYSSDPIRIPGQSAVQFGVVLSEPPINALVTPYLSLNRTQFVAGLFTDREKIQLVNTEAFEGVRPIPWNNHSERIIMDDLDLNFVVIDGNGTSTPGRVAAEGTVALDQGIRINTGNQPDDWNRIPSASAHGQYRHTFISIMAGEGDKKAILSSTIPQAGLWDLEVHIPSAVSWRQDNMRGIWNLELISANGREKIAFDNRAAIAGWNLIGSYELPQGEVTIEVTNETDAIVVIVDAFAWTPVNTTNGAAQ